MSPGDHDSLIPEPDDSLLPAPAPKISAPPESHFRNFADHTETRKRIYDNALEAAQNTEPVANQRHTLKLSNVYYMDPGEFTKAEHKDALIRGATLGRRMLGTWELHDNATGQKLDERTQVIGRVPHLTDLGTFVNNGSDYSLTHQQRLMPGVYARRKENGELEAHANVLPGKGISHHYHLDPAKSTFKISIGQAHMPLMPLLKAMGASDTQLRDAWGPEIHTANVLKSEHGVIDKLVERMLPKADREHPDADHRRAALVKKFNDMELDPEISQHTIGKPYDRLTLDSILDTTKNLIAINRGEREVDERDHPAHQLVMGPEDLFSERLRRDHGRLRRNLLMKASFKGHLRDMPSSALSPQVEQALLGSGLGQALEEINPAEVFDKQSRVTRMGEGGIPSLDAVPDEARNVHPGHLGFIDPLRTPESFRAGIDVNTASGTRKGADGRLYTQMKDPRTGELHWKSPQDLTSASIAFPGALSARTERVRVMRDGKIDYVKKRDVDFVLPNAESMFSPLGNLVPLKSMVKGQRIAMASRMLTQALPVTSREAPLVQSGVPGSKGTQSFEQQYGEHMGAINAKKGGSVLAVTPDGIKVKYADGTTEKHELYDHFPFNRKTFLHHTALVRPGDNFEPGQTLAKSNYTDDKGHMAIGTNLNTAYMPWEGYNFEDAQVISEHAAKNKLASEHMYHHDIQVDDKHKMGMKNFISLFPGKYDKKQLESMDDDGLIKPGMRVEHGQPLILAARERDRAENKVHKQRQAGHNDQSVVWDHHDPGIVTDVVRGKSGPVVLVKSVAPMQVGDKLSGRYGDKGVIAAIIPDHQMPHDKNGQPFDVLLNPRGIISRTNPAQKAELWLGKIAQHLGEAQKVEDFQQPDMMQHVHDELRRHGLSPHEDIVHPGTGRVIPNIATGNRFFMKLHHTAESKGQGRGGGSYGADETPSKGGAGGCFTGDMEVHVCYDRPAWGGRPYPIREIVENRDWGLAVTADPTKNFQVAAKAITDWFTFRVPPTDLIELLLSDGSVLRVTKNHEMILKDGTRKAAGALVPGDDLMEFKDLS